MTHGRGRRELSPEAVTLPDDHPLHKLPRLAGMIGGVVLLIAIALGVQDPKQFYFSYLTNYVYFLTFAVGGMFFVLVQHAAKAGWSVTVRRLAENLMGTIPVFAVMFIPILVGSHSLYHWTHPEAVATDELIKHKAPYLNTVFFAMRAVVFIGLWWYIARWFMHRSEEQDRTADHELTKRMERAAGPGLIVFALTTTYASFDWIMSLDPHWFSTIFGVYFFSGSLVAMFAAMSIMAVRAREFRQLRTVITIEHLHDLGKFLFAFVVFWTYIAFSQFMLIWYANIPEETIWYAHRLEGTWEIPAMLLMIGHFGVPFFYLMSRHIKRNTALLTFGAVWMLAMHYVDIYWLIMPVAHPEGVTPSWLDLACFVGIGSVFVATLSYVTNRHALVPRSDPRLNESLDFVNF